MAPLAREPGDDPITDWDAIRVKHCIPEAGTELVPEDSYILECGFERLHGVDFRKELLCRAGSDGTDETQDRTAQGAGDGRRHRHAEPAPRYATENLSGGCAPVRGGRAIAYLRFDRALGPMRAGDATIELT